MYTGTPGSGKTLHAVLENNTCSLMGQRVIANIDIVPTRKQRARNMEPLFWDNTEITVKRLFQYAKQNHKRGKEHQTLLIIDEAQILFNCRAFSDKGRADWVRFFSLHRHLGYDIILITQWDRMLDRQIRVMAEYNVKHRKVNNFRLIGMFLTLFRIKLFVAIEVWYGINEINRKSFFRYKRRHAKLYDSYANFRGFDDDDGEPGPPTEDAPEDGAGGQGDLTPAADADRVGALAAAGDVNCLGLLQRFVSCVEMISGNLQL
jgi:zona occludens toxin (predicted ATPase)